MKLSNALTEIRDEIVIDVTRELRAHAPVRTGRLRDSFRPTRKDEVTSDVPYAIYVEKYRPYVDKAIDAVVRRWDGR